jgi:hypothetical protein
MVLKKDESQIMELAKLQTIIYFFQEHEFYLFGSLMIVDMVIFALMSCWFMSSKQQQEKQQQQKQQQQDKLTSNELETSEMVENSNKLE